MKLRRLVPVLCLWAAAGNAADIVVEAGEHADFSRLVLQLRQTSDWEFGKVEGGYELRFDSDGDRFDFSQVFQKIPKSRIRSVSDPAAGQVRLEVSCDCHADAFEIREGRIVLDIKDGPPAEGSEFENSLPEPRAQVKSAAPDSVETAIAGPKQGTRNPFPTFRPALSSDREYQYSRDFTDLSLSDSVDGATEKEVQPSQLVDRPASDATFEPEIKAPTQAASAATHLPPSVSLDSQLLPLFGFESEPLDPGVAKGDSRLSLMEDALLRQLGRASSQGLIVMESPATAPPGAQSVENADRRESSRPAQVAATADEPPAQHIRIETAFDRAAPSSDAGQEMTFQGDECLPDDYFDVASWGPKDTRSGLSLAINRSVLGEFDVPLEEEIEMAVRHYIFLGFGIEAKSLLSAFTVEIDRADVLWQLADVVDDPGTVTTKALRTQISCDSMAALWGVLATPRLEAGDPVNAPAVLQHFSALPIHLRRHLGQPLATRFLEAGDPATATAIRNMITRNPDVAESGIGLLQARIDAELGKADASLEQLQRIVADGGPDAAEALVELIDAKFTKGQPVDTMTSQLAEAFAYENRGTDIGRRLNLTSIRGMIAASQVEAAFEAIVEAKDKGGLSTTEAEDFLATAHMKNAETSTNVDFLRLLRTYGNPTANDSSAALAARRAVATRLLDLGFNNRARAMLLAGGRPPDREDRLQLAQAALADRKPDVALSYLTGLDTGNATTLRAKALEMNGQLRQAANLYQDQELAADAGRAAWTSGDWDAVAAYGTGPQKSAADLFKMSTASAEATADPASNTLPSGTEPPSDATATLQSGRTIVEHSALARQVIAGLLEPR
ncbi:MAG: hypothetical protein WBN04_20360 [Paracoccaceae bacterium]